MSAQIGKKAPNLKVSEWVQGNDTKITNKLLKGTYELTNTRRITK